MLDEIRAELITEVQVTTSEVLDPKVIVNLKKKFLKKTDSILKNILPDVSLRNKKFIIGTLLNQMLGLEDVEFLLGDPKKRMRFIGHGCAIGPEHINERLSKERAQVFHKKFLSDVRQQYPDLYDQIKQKIDPPEGLGESEPLILKSHDGDTILLGDNNTPLGRQLNRRVMVMFYTAR